MQHFDFFGDLAAPAVVFQTRGQNSWVNFSGQNAEANAMRIKARALKKEGKIELANKLLKKAEKLFKFAEPKVSIFPNIFNFRRYETARRISEQKGIDSRADKRVDDLSTALETYSARSRGTRGVNKRDIRESKRLGSFYVDAVAEYTFDESINNGILAAFPKFKGASKLR
jgi:hypothetical protein